MLSTIQKTDEGSLKKITQEMELRKTREFFILFAMGSQTAGLIFAQIARQGVFCILADPRTVTAEDVRRLKGIGLIGIVISGGPYSVYSKSEPVPFDTRIFDLGIPVFGICLGFQMMMYHRGASVVPGVTKEYAEHKITLTDTKTVLFAGLPAGFAAWQNHGDEVKQSPHFKVTARSERGIVAAGESGYLSGVQFHPEVSHTQRGGEMFENFVFGVCGAQDRFPAQSVAEEKIRALREKIGAEAPVLLLLSGGSDSSIAAFLLKKALGENSRQILALYIKGLDREDDEKHVREYFGNEPWLTLEFADATEEFLEALKDNATSHKKRLAVKGVYARVAERVIQSRGIRFVLQGTIYPDISESGLELTAVSENGIELLSLPESAGARKAKIKIHHNTRNMFSVPELVPLVTLVKDTGRDVGRAIGVHEELLVRHPFPGVGLAIRIEGEVTAEKLAVLRRADGIWIDEIRQSGKYREVWQAGVDLTLSSVTCVKGDEAMAGMCVELWAVASVNGFTARPFQFDVSFLEKVATRIAAEVPEVGSASFVVMPKPPRTIERG